MWKSTKSKSNYSLKMKVGFPTKKVTLTSITFCFILVSFDTKHHKLAKQKFQTEISESYMLMQFGAYNTMALYSLMLNRFFSSFINNKQHYYWSNELKLLLTCTNVLYASNRYSMWGDFIMNYIEYHMATEGLNVAVRWEAIMINSVFIRLSFTLKW